MLIKQGRERPYLQSKRWKGIKREVRDKRITTLEADNYEEEATIDFDDEYGDDEVIILLLWFIIMI